MHTNESQGIHMSKKPVTASRDHIQSLAKCSPLQAVEELIWNGLDAGGPSVEVTFKLNELTSIGSIRIIDKGSGIPPRELDRAFGAIGDSKKPQEKTTREGRALHGREGRGRFKALALCPQPRWVTTYRDNGQHLQYIVKVRRDEPDFYEATEPKEVSARQTGTIVHLDYVDAGEQYLQTDAARENLTKRLALYLSEYPSTSVIYGGHRLNVDEFIHDKKRYDLPTEDLGRPKAALTVIEWRFKIDNRRLYLCSVGGFSHYDMPARVQAPGVDYTAYLCSTEVDEWHKADRFVVAELDPDIQQLIDLAREQLRTHLRERLAQGAEDVVEEWKRLDVYPYGEHERATPIDTAERQVFDIIAVQVNEHHPSFRDSDTDSKRLTLALIRRALESNPSALSTILRDVVRLPQKEQDAFAELLQRTPLSSLIKAGRIVIERLDVLQAFEHILFDVEWKKKLLERTQLHRLLVRELWILGEEYSLCTDDEGLREVLRKHLHILGREEMASDVDVKQINGKDGIPDLMLSVRRKIDRSLFEHLVVELKRPLNPLGQEEITQVEKYAFTVSQDERFNTDKVIWRFVLLGNDLDKYAIERASGDALPEGCIYRKKNLSIWVRRWADVLIDARDRHEFFRQKLEAEASSAAGIEHLRSTFPHLMTGRGASKKKDLETSANQSD